MEAGGLRAVQDELDRWRDRQGELEEELQRVKEEEKELLEELAKVDEQVAYYESLTKDMKKELEPPKLAGLLSSLKKG